MDNILQEWLQPGSKSPSDDQWSQIKGNLENMTTHRLILLYCFVNHKHFEINKQTYMADLPMVSRRWFNLCNVIKHVYDVTASEEKAAGYCMITTMHKLDSEYEQYRSYSIIFS